MLKKLKKAAKESVRRQLQDAAMEIVRQGGWSAFANGEWILHLTERHFRKHSQKTNAQLLLANYPSLTREQMAQKLIKAATKKAAMVGAITGLAVSADELVGLFTAAEAGVGLPANIAIAATAICAEVFITAKIQLQLVAELGTLYEHPLDPGDSADMLRIMNFAFGGGVAELAGKEVSKLGAQFSEAAIGRYYAKKESFEVLKDIARKLTSRLLRKSLANAIVPGVSMFMGAVWNKRATKASGRMALEHIREQAAAR